MVFGYVGPHLKVFWGPGFMFSSGFSFGFWAFVLGFQMFSSGFSEANPSLSVKLHVPQ